jgi:hypothetical protein
MLRAISLLPLSLLLLSCSTMGQRDPTASVDWHCAAKTTINNGDVQVNRWLDSSGALSSTVVVWTPYSQAAPGLRVVGIWQALSPAKIDLDRGLAMFDWTDGSFEAQPKNTRYTLELRVRPDGPWDGYGKIAGNFALHNGVRLSADWAEIKAMARGSDRLFLILKNRKDMAVSSHELQPTLFTGFEATVQSSLDESAAMAQNYRSRCQYLRSNEIII